MGTNRQPFRIGNRQRNSQPLPITTKSISYRIGNGISEKSLPRACKHLILKQSAIGNSAYKERTLCRLGSFLFVGRVNQGGYGGLFHTDNGDAIKVR